MKVVLVLVLGSFLGIFSKCSKEVDTHITIGFNNKTDRELGIYASFTYPDTSITLDIFKGV